MKERKRNRATYMVIVLLLLVIGVSIGYASLSKTLNINGTSQLAQNASWNVHFTNLNVTAGSVTAQTPATINGDVVNYAVDLNTPGDFYEFTVDVINEGTINAKLGTAPTMQPLTPEQQKYLNYKVTYEDDSDITINDELDSESTKTVKVRLEFKKDITELPTDLGTINLNYSMNYVQK